MRPYAASGGEFDNIITIAEERLRGPTTAEITAWDDGDFSVRVYHSISETLPYEAMLRGEEDGLPYYRERISYSTTDNEPPKQEVVRRECNRTQWTVIWSEEL